MPLNIDPQQILLHMFNLVLLFGILYILLYKPVRDFMKKREDEYRQRDEDTKKALADAQKLKEEFEQQLSDAEKDNAALRAKISAEAEADREKIIMDAHERAAGIVENARDKAQKEHDRLVATARGEITEYVSKAAEKIVMDDGLEDDFDSFFESVNAQKDSENG